ncbi:MAG TPA: hypothetical protein VEJ18_17905 [Planctomycetota bacterium]|nr:hypothetical protein [Planctomycetota bacterium]
MGRWKDRMARMGKAAQEAREGELVEMTLERAARILEGLLVSPLTPARRKRRHPVSLSRRRKRRRR